MTDANQSELLAARQAIATGRVSEARRLLQSYVRRAPEDHHGWLWLAGVTSSPQASLEYLSRAERLKPGDPAVAKARAWAEQRLAAQAPAPKSPRPEQPPASPPTRSTATAAAVGAATGATARSTRPGSPTPPPTKTDEVVAHFRQSNQPPPEAAAPTRRYRWLAAGAALMALLAILAFVALLTNPQLLPATIVLAAGPAGNNPTFQTANTSAANDGSAAIAVPAVSATPLPSPTASEPEPIGEPSATPTQTPFPTPTLAPTFTPVPSPTPAPTVIVYPGGDDILSTVNVTAGERWIDVNLSTQTLVAYEGSEPVFTTLISSGMAGHATVTGQFHIWLRFESQTMDGRLLGYDYYLEDVPYVMYFYNDYALHGTFWHNNFGTPMSHGCVNLATPDAQWLFNWSSLGTMVNVHY